MSAITSLGAGAAFVGGALFGGGKKSPQSRSFDIDSFAAELGKNGNAKPYLFSVIVSPPGSIFNTVLKMEGMSLRIDSVSIPRRSLMTIDQRYYGPTRKIPYMVTDYASMNMEIILSEDMREREMFMQWQDLFFSGGNKPNNASRLGKQTYNYDSTYYDECIGSVEILQYAESPIFQGTQSRQGLLQTIIGTAQAVGINTSAITNPFGINLGIGSERNRSVKECYRIQMVEAYPISIQEVPMSWSSEGIAKLNVEIQFRNLFETNNIQNAKTQGRGLADLVRSGINTINAFRPTLGVISKQGLGGALGSGLKSTSASATGGTRGLFTF
jgi:hypothetical protein